MQSRVERVTKYEAARILGITPQAVVESAAKLPGSAKIGMSWTFNVRKLERLAATERLKVTGEVYGPHMTYGESVKGFIYFARSGEFIKIGFSKNVEGRLKELRTASPNEIELLHKMRGTLSKELDFHYKFHKFRVRGEWFLADESLLAFINKKRSQASV